jgi:hypothetical protein
MHGTAVKCMVQAVNMASSRVAVVGRHLTGKPTCDVDPPRKGKGAFGTSLDDTADTPRRWVHMGQLGRHQSDCMGPCVVIEKHWRPSACMTAQTSHRISPKANPKERTTQAHSAQRTNACSHLDILTFGCIELHGRMRDGLTWSAGGAPVDSSSDKHDNDREPPRKAKGTIADVFVNLGAAATNRHPR